MARPQTPQASLPKRLANFTNTTAGMDMALRLLQALAMIATVLCPDKQIVMKSSIAVSQLALGRRYLRFLSSYGLFQRVYDLLSGKSVFGGSILTMSYLAEYTGLGIYLAMEDTTILHDMNIWLVPWYMPVLHEANKFWFYAICISIARSLWGLVIGFPAKTSTQNGDANVEKKGTQEEPTDPDSRAHLLERIIIDSCDLCLPGSFVGWIPLEDLGVGMAMVVSTVLTSREIWATAQR